MSNSLFSELKRRNVFKVAAGYAILGWVVLQIADVVVPILELPEWTLKLLLFFGIFGFPFAIFFAWVYELTPDGIKKESEITDDESITKETSKKLNILVFALLVIALGYFIYESRFHSDGQVTETEVVQRPQDDKTADVHQTTEASIAVLPFVNMSSDAEQEYFSDGITEEILNVLAKVPKLHVTSRSSAFYYKGKDIKLSEVARELGVANILEGSVRKSGNRIRITAQLIEAESDKHLWSETYDRELTDVFAIQDEISQAIASVLKGILQTNSIIKRQPTKNLEAYDLFLKGRQAFYKRGSALDDAIDYLNQAVKLDPDFADAWVYLSGALSVASGYITEITDEDAAQQLSIAITKAMQLAPESSMAHAIRGYSILELQEIGRHLEAYEYLNRAISLNSSDSTAQLWMGIFLLNKGHMAKAIEHLEMAIKLDPASGINNGYLSLAYFSTAQYERGYFHTKKALEYGWIVAFYFILPSIFHGDIDVDLEELGKKFILGNSEFGGERINFIIENFVEFKPGDPLPEVFGDSDSLNNRLFLVSNYLDHGYTEEYLQQVSELANDEQLSNEIVMRITRKLWMPQHRDIIQDPRFIEIAKQIGYFEFWQAKGFPDGCELVESNEPRLSCN